MHLNLIQEEAYCNRKNVQLKSLDLTLYEVIGIILSFMPDTFQFNSQQMEDHCSNNVTSKSVSKYYDFISKANKLENTTNV